MCRVVVQTMVKRELVNTLVKAFPGISKQDMLTVVDAFFESMAWVGSR